MVRSFTVWTCSAVCWHIMPEYSPVPYRDFVGFLYQIMNWLTKRYLDGFAFHYEQAKSEELHSRSSKLQTTTWLRHTTTPGFSYEVAYAHRALWAVISWTGSHVARTTIAFGARYLPFNLFQSHLLRRICSRLLQLQVGRSDGCWCLLIVQREGDLR